MGLDLKERVNCFTLELYPESETLQFDTIMEIVKSTSFYSCKYYYILHDKDYNKKTGEIKKAHYHLLIKLDNAISIEKIIKALINERGSQEAIENDFSIVKSFKGMVRYLIHKDNPEKEQYKLEEVVTNDRNISYYFNDNTIVENFQLLVSIIKDNKIRSMRDLIYHCVDTNNIVAMQYIQDNAYLVSCLFRYNKSNDNKVEND